MWARLLLTFLALTCTGCLSWCQPVSNVANVTTGQELLHELNNGTQHVLVADHLSMLELKPQQCGKNKWLLCVDRRSHNASDELVTIWGNCQAEFNATALRNVTLPNLKDGQCVVRVAWGWLGVAGTDVWVHKLHVVLAAAPGERGEGAYSNLIDIWSVADEGAAQLWFTTGGLQGDGSTGHLLDVWSSEATGLIGKAYLSDCFLGDARLADNSGIVSVGYTLVNNTVFSRIARENASFHASALMYVQAYALLCLKCTKGAGVSVEMFAVDDVSGKLFTDAPSADVYPRGTQLLPAEQAPMESFLNASDPRLRAAETRRAEVEVMSGPDLQAAIVAGHMHVHVVEHLDMQGVTARPCGGNSSLLCVSDDSHSAFGIFSVRGTCKTEFYDGVVADVLLPRLQPFQCVVTHPASSSWLTVLGRAAWIHNLHVVLQRGFNRGHIKLVQVESGRAGGRAWLTSVGLQGNSATMVYLMDVRSHGGVPAKVLFSGGFLGDARHHAHPGILARGLTAVQHTAIERLLSTRRSTKGAIVADGWGVRSENNTFSGNTFESTTANFQRRNGGRVYADAEAQVWEFGTDAFTAVLDLGDAPDSFLTLHDAELQDLQSRLGVPPTRLPQASPPPLSPGSMLPATRVAIGVSTAVTISLIAGAIAGWFYWRQPPPQPAHTLHTTHTSWDGSLSLHRPPSPQGGQHTCSASGEVSSRGLSDVNVASGTPAGGSLLAVESSGTSRSKERASDGVPHERSLLLDRPDEDTDAACTNTSRAGQWHTASWQTTSIGTLSVPFPTTSAPPQQQLDGRAPPELSMQRLVSVLDDLYRRQVLLFDRFKVPSSKEVDRRRGGQALVQFVEDMLRARHQFFAVKFFIVEAHYQQELAVYKEPALREAMPAVLMSVESGAWSPEGWDQSQMQLPSCLVMERGQSMQEYVKASGHNLFTTIQALGHIVEKLGALHKAGWVHRDLKPDNLLWNEHSHRWSLLDFGCAARSGSLTRMAYTLYYAAPEVIVAEEDGHKEMVVTPALDVWSIGVIAFEMLTEERIFSPFASRTSIRDAALGHALYPWEREECCESLLQKLRRFRDAVLACLRRDPEERVDCDVLYKMLVNVFDDDYTLTPDPPGLIEEAAP